MTEPFVIRAVQQNSLEKPCRGNGGIILKEKKIKKHGKHEVSIQLLRTSMLSPRELLYQI